MTSISRAVALVPGRALAVLSALLLLAWLTGAARAGTDPADAGRLVLPGVRLGMTPEAVGAALAARSGATPTATIRRPDGRPGPDGRTYVQRVFHELRDGRGLQVVFSDPASGNRAVEITLVDPRAEGAAALRAEAERLYGPPAAVLPIAGGDGFIAAWEGTAETEGAIRPLPGATASLRLEFAPGPGSNLRLTSNAGPDPANTPPAAEPPPGSPGR
jgi:hypothetical protein